MPVTHCQSAMPIIGIALLLVTFITASDHVGAAVHGGQAHELEQQQQLSHASEVAADGEGCQHFKGTALTGPCESRKLQQSDLRNATSQLRSTDKPDRDTSPPAAAQHDAGRTVQNAIDGNSASAIDDLLQWVKALPGAQVNVTVGETPGAGRAVFSTGHIQKGQSLLAVPIDAACFQQSIHGGDGTMEVLAIHLYEAMSDPEHYLQPYFATLPRQEEVLCPWASMPKEYLFMLQSDILESLVLGFQMTMKDFWNINRHELLEDLPSMTYDDLKYLRSLLSTRQFGHKHRGSMMCPVLDMTNHRFNCPHSYSPGPCPSAPDLECLVLSAGAYVGPGDEVCIGYKYNMLNDRSMLQYGFLQSAPADLLLHGVDRYDFNRSTLWLTYDEEEFGPPLFKPESLMEAEGELGQLKMLLERLRALDPLADRMTAAPGDPHGVLLTMMRQWRQQRQAALQLEVQRMQDVVSAMSLEATETAAEVQDSQQEAVSFDKVTADLVHWLLDNGAQVSPHLTIGASHIPSAGAGLLATADLPSGSVLAVIPWNLTLPVYGSKLLVDLPFLLSSLTDPRNPHKPYWDAMAAAKVAAKAAAGTAERTAVDGADSVEEAAEHQDIMDGTASTSLPRTASIVDPIMAMNLSKVSGTSFYNLPLEYLPLLQHKPTEAFIRKTRAVILGHPAAKKQHLLRWLQPADLPHVLSMVSTRAVPFDLQGPHLTPLYDMANHQDGCPNTLQVLSCKDVLNAAAVEGSTKPSTAGAGRDEATANGRSPYCVVWKAGQDIPAGSEICASYSSPLSPDDALLLYGFFLNTTSPSGPGALYPMDRADFIPGGLPWHAAAASSKEYSSAASIGPSHQQSLEKARLQTLLKQLGEVDEASASVQPAAEDPGGHVLAAILAWRQQRHLIVLTELLKLEQQQLVVE